MHSTANALGTLSVIALMAILMSAPGWAEDPLVSPVNTCTALNCKSSTIRGRVNAQGSTPNPWVGQFLNAKGGSNCARFHIVSQNTDLEMSVVAPDGFVYTSDQGGGSCFACPRVVISPVSLRGAYTVVVNHWLGTAVEGGFQMQVSQYNLGNPNCSSPTPPLSAESAAERAKIRKAKGN